MIADTDSGAGRLLRLLDGFRACTSSAPNQHLSKAWASFLGVRMPGETWKIFREIGKVAALINNIDAQLAQLPDHEILVSWVPTVRNAVCHLNLTTATSTVFQTVDENVINLIRICDRELRQHRPEPTVKDAQLQLLLEAVHDLAQVISDTELDPELRDYLRYHLDLIENAVSDYRIMGIVALENALQACIGARFVREKQYEAAKSSSCVREKFLKILGLLALVTAGDQGGKGMLIDASRLLPGVQVDEQSLAQAHEAEDLPDGSSDRTIESATD